MNYITNALKYGGDPPQVELGADVVATGADPAAAADAHVRFWVRDNGDGLTEDEQERLFTPFERLHQTRAHGHGLGLSIVRRIINRLDGEVGVESEALPGKGSTFYFTLPAPPGNQRQVPVAQQSRSRPAETGVEPAPDATTTGAADTKELAPLEPAANGGGVARPAPDESVGLQVDDQEPSPDERGAAGPIPLNEGSDQA
jgi:hypothetical protein